MSHGKVLMTLIAALSYTLTFVLASSVEADGSPFSIDISRHDNKLAGPAAYRALLLRHDRYVSQDIDAAAENPSILINSYKARCTPQELAELENESGSVPAHAIGKVGGFYAPFTIGKSNMNLLIDTGSSDLWVYSARLPKNETQGHQLYNTSTGEKLKNHTWKIKYGDGTSAAGVVYSDSVQVGNATATSQAVEAATSISGQHIVGKSVDGILGLGFKHLNSVKPHKQSPLWETLAPVLKKKVFAVDFSYNSTGTLEFGKVSPSKYKGNITYVPVPRASFWYFDHTAYKVNGTVIPAYQYEPSLPTSLLDTGASFLHIAGHAATAYYNTVKGAKMINDEWLFPCHTKLSNMGFKIGGRFFDVYGEDFKQHLGEGICYGAVQGAYGGPSTKYDGGDIFGAPLVVGNYIVFDGEKQRLGFAHKHIAQDS